MKLKKIIISLLLCIGMLIGCQSTIVNAAMNSSNNNVNEEHSQDCVTLKNDNLYDLNGLDSGDFDSASNSIYTKLHFYISNDLIEYANINCKKHLIEALDAITSEYVNYEFYITVTFDFDVESTEDYKNIISKIDSTDDINQVRAIRNELVQYNDTFYKNAIKEYLPLLSEFPISNIKEIGLSSSARGTITTNQLDMEFLSRICEISVISSISIDVKTAICDSTAIDLDTAIELSNASTLI